MERVADMPSKAAGRRRKSAADVHSLLSRPRPQSSTPLQSITEDGPAFRTPLSATPDANVQLTKTAELPKKARRRSSTAGGHVEVAERKANPPQTRSFMEVKRSEEAHVLKAQRLENVLGHVQAELTSAKVEALRATEEVSALKARLSKSEEERELLSSRHADSAHELAAGRSELQEIRQKLQKALEECTSAKSEAATSAEAAREASERNKALMEALQRRMMQPGLTEELRDVQQKVHEQDEFAASLSDLHEQVERTRQEIKERMEKAAEKASALGLGTIVDGLSDSRSRSMSPPLQVETSMEQKAQTPITDRVLEGGDGSTISSESSSGQQLSDLSAMCKEGVTVSLQTEVSSEDSKEHVSLLANAEAAGALVAVESSTQLDCPVGKAAGEPGCTEDLMRRFEEEGVRSPHEQLEAILVDPSIKPDD